MNFESKLTIFTLAAAALTVFIILVVIINLFRTVGLLKAGRKY